MSKKMREGRRIGMGMCRDMRARTVTVSLTVVAIALVSVFAYTASAAEISVEPACQVVSEGEIFTVNISVDPEGNEISGAEYILYFNNTLLNATSQVNGSFLSHDGVATNVYSEINNTIGELRYHEYRYATYGVTNPGVLATITFQVIAEEGISELRFDESWTLLSDPYANPISPNITNGSVRIGFCGDVSGNGVVTGYDYTVLKLYVGGVPGWKLNCCCE
ncbi:MAG: hypothetical protein DRO11_04870 [Methanobacteriota archaeon]|nr:MAG: hypothetical protein DRO11_04870 [Euryarchaeota archaeon]